MASYIWNPWHGCRKYSEGCRNCYVYRRDISIGKDASVVYKTKDFCLPVKKLRSGAYRIPSGSFVYACMTSDFFLEDADPWRDDVWRMIREREDLDFGIITKRIIRFSSCIPQDWGRGYDNVSVCLTVENQEEADKRLPVFSELPIRHKSVICEPLLGRIDLSRYLYFCDSVTVGGESGQEARICDFKWVEDIRRQCKEQHIPFHYHQTGAKLLKDGKLYRIPRKLQSSQAGLAFRDKDL